MNDRQIAFIMCVNDDRQADESEFYIRCLDVPEHYEVDVIRVREAVSMAAGYNAAMQSSEARYKVSASGYTDHFTDLYQRYDKGV